MGEGIGILQRSFGQYHSRPSIYPFPRLQVRNRHQKLQSLLSQEWVKRRASNLAGMHSQDPSEQKPIKNFGQDGAWAYPRTVHFFGTPYYLRNFKLCTHIHRIDRNKSPLKSSGKVAVGVVSDFSGHPQAIQGASRAHLCDSEAFLLINNQIIIKQQTTQTWVRIGCWSIPQWRTRSRPTCKTRFMYVHLHQTVCR